MRNHRTRLALLSLAFTALSLALATGAAAAVPQNTSPPTISGTAREAQTLTVSNGTWTNSPTSFTYQWQRCGSDGTGCGDIVGAATKSYTLVTADVGHTVRAVVTAVNADGKTSASSAPTDVVASKTGPTNTVRPTVSGSAIVGGTLTVSDGTWSPTPSSFTRQWQRCDSAGASCLNIAGATGQSYGVRTEDVGHRLRALVTAHTSSGQATAASTASAVVTQTTSTVTQTTTAVVTTPAPKVPTIAFLSLRISGDHVFARFRICVQSSGKVAITERDQKARALPFTRHFSVSVGTCASFSRHWLLLSRFRSPGLLLVTLRASSHGQLSRLAERTVRIH